MCVARIAACQSGFPVRKNCMESCHRPTIKLMNPNASTILP
jgi:hypothetical protein